MEFGRILRLVKFSKLLRLVEFGRLLRYRVDISRHFIFIEFGGNFRLVDLSRISRF